MASIQYTIKDLDKIIKLDGKVKNAEISRLTAPGENYVSLVLRVDIEVEKNGHSRTINSVAKCLPPGSKKEEGFDLHEMTMKNEIRWYSEIVPLIKEFGEEIGITLTYIPECFGTRFSLDSSKTDPDKEAVLLLENLIPQGYQNYDRYIGSDFDTSKAILKQLAIFHALPIVIRYKKPELFEVIKHYLEECRPKSFGPPPKSDATGSDGPRKMGPPGGVNIEEIFLEQLSNKQEFAPYISKLKPVFDKPLMGLAIFTNMAKEPWNTITHNDFWVNNFMVNFREGKETLVKIVDYQMCAYGSFTRDLVFFLLTSVKNDVVKVHMDDLLRFYYEEFTSVLQIGKLDLELSYAEYLEEVRKSAVESEVGHAIFFSTVVCGKKEKPQATAVEDVHPLVRVANMLKNINQIQVEKLLLISSEAVARNWI